MKKLIAITGCTGAIGRATALAMAKTNSHLILIGRNSEKISALKAEIIKTTDNHDVDIVIADLSEPASLKKAAEEIKKKYSSLDALINIAAIFTKNRKENSIGLEYMFATNHLGPFVLTNSLLDLIKAAKGRVINVSAPSTTKINFDDLQSKTKFSAGFLGVFGATKMMNIVFTYALAKRLEGSGATAMVFHPGLVKTELTSNMGAVMHFILKLMSGNADKASNMLTRLATDDTYQNSNGKFYKFDGKEMKSSAYSYDEAIQEKLWKVSEELMK